MPPAAMTVHRGVLGTVLFSFACAGSALTLLLLGNLLHLFPSVSVVILFLVTFLRTGFLIFTLYYPLKKRLPRFGSLMLTLSGLIAFNYAFPIVCEAVMNVILEVFLDQWSRSKEEEEYISRYFLDGYDHDPDESTWKLSTFMTLGYLLSHEMCTFGLCFSFTSRVSAYTTPFFLRCGEYETVVLTSPLGTPGRPTSNTLIFTDGAGYNGMRYPISTALGRELPHKASRNSCEYSPAVATAPPSPPQNPMWVVTASSPPATSSLQCAGQEEQKMGNDISVKAYPVA